MIKKTLLTLATLATIASGSITVTASTGENLARQPQLYPQAFTVEEVDKENDLVYIKTPAGFIYSFEGSEDWMIGDIAAAIMSDNATETITDDQIISVRYCGYIDQAIK